MADENDTGSEPVEVTTSPDITALELAIAESAAREAAYQIQITDLIAQNDSLNTQLAAARAANLALLNNGSQAEAEPEPEVVEPEVPESEGIDSLFKSEED